MSKTSSLNRVYFNVLKNMNHNFKVLDNRQLTEFYERDLKMSKQFGAIEIVPTQIRKIGKCIGDKKREIKKSFDIVALVKYQKKNKGFKTKEVMY